MDKAPEVETVPQVNHDEAIPSETLNVQEEAQVLHATEPDINTEALVVPPEAEEPQVLEAVQGAIEEQPNHEAEGLITEQPEQVHLSQAIHETIEQPEHQNDIEKPEAERDGDDYVSAFYDPLDPISVANLDPCQHQEVPPAPVQIVEETI